MLTKEIEISIDIERSPQFIVYILKFAQNEINAVQPPVEIINDPRNPSIVYTHVLKKSLGQVQESQIFSKFIL